MDDWLPLAVREHFTRDTADLLAEVAHLRSVLDSWTEDWERLNEAVSVHANGEVGSCDTLNAVYAELTEPDLSSCPYYQSMTKPDAERGTCDRGCYSEPACITDEPAGGWPATRNTERAAR